MEATVILNKSADGTILHCFPCIAFQSKCQNSFLEERPPPMTLATVAFTCYYVSSWDF